MEPRDALLEANTGAPVPQNHPDSDVVVVTRFDTHDEIERWAAFDDVIMGGISLSRMELDPRGFGVFTGEVSLENSGGFASTRSTSREWGLGGARGLALRVRGDGHAYKVNARTAKGLSDWSWQGAFAPTSDAWSTVRIPFEAFVPRRRGETLDGVGPVPPEAIRRLGLLIADKQVGPFRLEIEWLGYYR